MRLDKYLKVSRIIKRRTVASEAASLGRIQINGKVAKPSSEVKEGDMLDILMGGKHTVVKVTCVQEFTTKAAAAEMYEMITRGDLE
ncbi:MAG: RNA-binding S4 domain-containing protein [Eubacteriales bacterium]|nr:RNA-binding S4 domain-containing protein [Clostridiales bacterium]MDY5710092.1 RNA-binding S4 domain-containing protein [Eubacteriales bacterium]